MALFNAAFGGFSVDDQEKAKTFYVETLGFKVIDEEMGLRLGMPGGGEVFIYPKDDHQPATYTVLNLIADNIDEAVDKLNEDGVEFERYDNLADIPAKPDDKGIMRGLAAKQGPDIAWFKDPAGNILAVMQVK